MKKLIEKLKPVILNNWVQLAFRLILGSTFIVASLDKIIHPKLFAEAIYSYQLLPVFLVNLAAAVMAMLELIIGITLIIGFLTRSSSFILSGLLLVFIIAISINLIRGLEISCGCFEVISDTKIGVDLLIRDILLLFVGIFIILKEKPGLAIDSLFAKGK